MMLCKNIHSLLHFALFFSVSSGFGTAYLESKTTFVGEIRNIDNLECLIVVLSINDRGPSGFRDIYKNWSIVVC
jgi:hypothetical protein